MWKKLQTYELSNISSPYIFSHYGRGGVSTCASLLIPLKDSLAACSFHLASGRATPLPDGTRLADRDGPLATELMELFPEDVRRDPVALRQALL